MTATTASERGAVVTAFAALDTAGIPWCIWKGSTHLDSSLAGAGDLDVLVAAPAASALSVLERHGLAATRGPRSSVVDLLGTGPSGRLLHVQVYDRLVIDDGLVDRWQLPVAPLVLAQRRRAAMDLWVTDPDVEAGLAVVAYAARPWWARRRRRPALLARLDTLVGDGSAVEASRVVSALLGEPCTGPTVDAVARAVARRLDGARGGRARYRARSLGAIATRAWWRAGRRAPTWTHRRGRTPAAGGILVAVVGADGSGKSSLVRSLHAALGSKLDVRAVYLGSGDGPASLRRLPAVIIRRRLRRRRTPGPGPRRDRRVTPARAVWAVLLAGEKRRKVARARRARGRGAVVVCDRYPQVTVLGSNDGPLLGAWFDAPGWRRRLARWEHSVYAATLEPPPDLVLRLDVSPEVASARRPDHDPADLEDRIGAVRSLRFGGAPVMALDADRPAADVLADALAAVLHR